MVLLLHVVVKNLNTHHLYLYVPPVQVRNPQVWVELYRFDLVLSRKRTEPRLSRLQLLQYLVPDEELEPENLFLLQLRLVRVVRI